MSIKLFLTLFCGICWTIAYLESIRIGFKYKTFAIPFLAIALNITWEAFNTYQGALIVGWSHVSTVFDIIWFLLDLVIIYTYLKYGIVSCHNKHLFYGNSILILLACLGFQYLLSELLGLISGALYSSSIMGVIMSILFIKMYRSREGAYGQSLSIAISKCLGTLTASILVGAVGVNSLGGSYPLVFWVGILIFVIDIYYIYLLINFNSNKA